MNSLYKLLWSSRDLSPDKRSSTVGGLDDDVASLKFGKSEPPCEVAGYWGGFDAETPMPRDDNREAEVDPPRLIKSPVSSAAEDPSTRSMVWGNVKPRNKILCTELPSWSSDLLFLANSWQIFLFMIGQVVKAYPSKDVLRHTEYHPNQMIIGLLVHFTSSSNGVSKVSLFRAGSRIFLSWLICYPLAQTPSY